MRLELNGIDVDCVIGERADERVRTQHLRIDVALTIGDRAAETDDLADTVDYAALTEKIRRALVAAKCRMIERAAKVVCEVCRAERGVLAATAKVTKSGAIAHLESASATFAVTA
ncbi:MAG: dihydroneopterin aldolase [Kiritimatiellia bacterium]